MAPRATPPVPATRVWEQRGPMARALGAAVLPGPGQRDVHYNLFSVTTPGTVCGLGSREVVVKGTMHRSDHQHLSVWGKGQKAWQTCASGIGQYGPSYQPAPGAPHPDGMATLGAGQVGPQPRSLFNLDQPRHLQGAPGSSGENNSGNLRAHVR